MRKENSSKDNMLRSQSRKLFYLDDRSQQILAQIALKGPLNVYELSKSSDPKLSRPAIYRRLNGDQRLIGLLKEHYLRLEGKTKSDWIQHREKKYYGLTLKGFLAALSSIKCEDIYMFKIFLETYKMNRPTPTEEKEMLEKKFINAWKIFLDKIKIDLLIFFQYHEENGLTLTHLKHPEIYFENFWSFIIPFDSKRDPFSSSEYSFFSEEWQLLWKERRTIMDDKEFQELLREYSFEGVRLVPWIELFGICCMSREAYDFFEPDFVLINRFLDAYAMVIEKLRKKVPWDTEALIIP